MAGQMNKILKQLNSLLMVQDILKNYFMNHIKEIGLFHKPLISFFLSDGCDEKSPKS